MKLLICLILYITLTDAQTLRFIPIALKSVPENLIESLTTKLATILETQIDPAVQNTRQRPLASTCQEVLRLYPDKPSGYYTIVNGTGSPIKVFCSMTSTFGYNLTFATKGWMRVGLLDMTDHTQQCPQNWTQYEDPKRVCGKKSRNQCDPVVFPSYGVRYSKVCGRLKGYQFGSTDGFMCYEQCFGPPYVDGVTITHGNPPLYVWTYAASLTPVIDILSSCPCDGGTLPSSHIGTNFYCESGLEFEFWEPVLYSKDPLWDGIQCEQPRCCFNPNLPWFCRELPSSTTNDLNVNICTDEGLNNEDVRIEFLELYIQ